jgi:PAS domain-containing protein
VAGQKPIELILARNLLSSLSTPAFLVDSDGELAFYNDAAGDVLGRRFEDLRQTDAAGWGAQFGPFDSDGAVVPMEELEVTKALRRGRPSHGYVTVRSASGEPHEIEVTGLPIQGWEGFSGAMVLFWPKGEGQALGS